MLNQELQEHIDYLEEFPILKMDGLDEACIGVVEGCMSANRLVYDYDKIIKILMERDEMSMVDAIEFYEYNIGSAYMGEYTPIIVKTYV